MAPAGEALGALPDQVVVEQAADTPWMTERGHKQRPPAVLAEHRERPRTGGGVAHFDGRRDGPEAGLTGRSRSWINVTDLHTVPKAELRHYRGRLGPVELRRLSTALAAYLDLEDRELDVD
ncbi:MAG: hypothetical protein WKF54_10455 [Nocardioidaceae bacterium]